MYARCSLRVVDATSRSGTINASEDGSIATPLDGAVLGALLGLFAHDLRNPLSALHSNVGFIGSIVDQDDQDAAEALSDALVSCDGLAAIIENLEQLAQYLAGARTRPVEQVNLVALVDDIIGRNQALAHSHGAQLEVDRASLQRAGIVRSSREMLGRCIANLVRNGIQHGGSLAPIVVSADSDAEFVTLYVRDQGPSVLPELADAVFTAPGQLKSKSRSGGRYSRGLGLFCAASAASLASVALSAAPHGAGSEFRLRMRK